ncbi:sensor histidine kinase [Tissierella sp. MSJ-40]|uniref:histidine kinase n=1 Tax=Tissierella simiarum TaxID=2841534 RepID=A0ABS6E4G8_9FIRM|nr:sensor histidine kinase [Tissierella simiarum]MBU5437808.1 sensor histidine kinase [Tissierella simiarum]
MGKLNKYNFYSYIALRILIALDIIYRCRSNITNLLIFLGLFLLIIVNDNLRINYFYKDVKKYYLSLFLSMIISIILAFNIHGYIDVYIYMSFYELILYTEGRISQLFVGLEIALFLLLLIFRTISGEEIRNIEFWKESLIDILMILLGLFFYLISLFTYKALRKEKKEVERLNEELELSYNKLKEQSEKIEELTITKERNRVAGEIHDNLGHSLVALNMNLDVIEKIIDRDIVKAKQLINKSHILTKESMEKLRKAVYALKEEGSSTLIDSIERMAANIEGTGEVKVILNVDEKVEDLLPEYKNIIYISIKEALTNSIKHGEAKEISINIKLGKNKIFISIEDNGLGCNSLVKGNGLIGIEDRINKFGGDVTYSDKDKKGFKMDLSLPI